jgi:hypothetical protein
MTAAPAGPGNSGATSPPRLFLPPRVAARRQAELPGFGFLLAAVLWRLPTSPIPQPSPVMHQSVTAPGRAHRRAPGSYSLADG